MMAELRIVPLGGLGEVGKNMVSIEYGRNILIVDAGIMFPEFDMLGVDHIIPDWGYLRSKRDQVLAVLITHGHEDHIGALPHFLEEFEVPVYATRLTRGLIEVKLRQAGILHRATLQTYAPGDSVSIGPFTVEPYHVCHSIPDSVGLGITSPAGLIVHSGDFKLDPTPIDGLPTDLPEFAALGRRGVRLLLADSTNAELPGFVPSESSLRQPLYELVVESRGRLIVACFSSHLHRIQQVVDAAVDAGRYVAFLGRSMQRNVATGEALGAIAVPPDAVIPLEEVLDLAPEKTAIVCTGSQGEPFSALSLMANGDHHWVTIEEGDTVVMSARAIPGNETRVSRVINELTRLGARVFHERNATVHVSGHGAQEELKTFLNVVRPHTFVPIHGEYRHLSAHAVLAREMKVPEVFVCQDGDRIVLDGEQTRVEAGAVPAGHVFVEGVEVAGDTGTIRDRRHLRDDGVIIVTVVLDGRTGDIVQGPFLDSHGFMREPELVLARAGTEVAAEVRTLAAGPPDLETVRRHMVAAVRRVTKEAKSRRTKARKTVVIPIVLEM